MPEIAKTVKNKIDQELSEETITKIYEVAYENVANSFFRSSKSTIEQQATKDVKDLFLKILGLSMDPYGKISFTSTKMEGIIKEKIEAEAQTILNSIETTMKNTALDAQDIKMLQNAYKSQYISTLNTLVREAAKKTAALDCNRLLTSILKESEE